MTDLQKPLNEDMDAMRWVKEFVQRHPEADEEAMLSWFANAIMCGFDEASRRAERKVQVFFGWLCMDIRMFTSMQGVTFDSLRDSWERFCQEYVKTERLEE